MILKIYTNALNSFVNWCELNVDKTKDFRKVKADPDPVILKAKSVESTQL